MDVVELADEVLKVGGGQLTNNTVLDKLDEHLVLAHFLDIAETRQLVRLLLSLSALLLLFLTTLLFLLSTRHLQLQVVQLHLDHVINLLLVLLLHNRHDFFTSHHTVILLLLVVAFISIGPILRVVLVELVELLHHFGGSDLEELVTTVIIVTAATLLGFFAFVFRLLVLLLGFLLLLSLGLLFILGGQGGLQVILLVELVKAVWDLSKGGSIPLNPVTASFEHAIRDVRPFDFFDFILKVILLAVEFHPVVLLVSLALILSGLSLRDRVILLFVLGLGLALHAKEDHLLLPHLLDGLTGEDSTDLVLDDLSGLFLGLLAVRRVQLAVVHSLANIVVLDLTSDLLESVQVTATTLTTSLVLLDQTDSRRDLQIESEGVISDLLNRLGSLVH